MKKTDKSKKEKKMKKNCWEFKGCSRQFVGKHSKNKRVCLASTMTSYDGVNDGDNGGRVCWMITGTTCNDEIQETFSHKIETCVKCDFYKAVAAEERTNLNLP